MKITPIREICFEVQSFLGSLKTSVCDRSDISFLRYSVEMVSLFVQKSFSTNFQDENVVLLSFRQFFDITQNLLNQMRADCFRCDNSCTYGSYSQKTIELIDAAFEFLSNFYWNLDEFESGGMNYHVDEQIITTSANSSPFRGCIPCHPLEDWKLENRDFNPTFFDNTDLQYVFACEKILEDKSGYELMRALGKKEELWDNRKTAPIFESEQDVIEAARYFGCSLNNLIDVAEVFHHPYPNHSFTPIIQKCSYFQIIRATEELLNDRCIPLSDFLESIGRKKWEWKNRHEKNYFFVKEENQVLDIVNFFEIDSKVFFAYASRFKDLEAWNRFREQQPILYQPNGTNEIFTSGFEEWSTKIPEVTKGFVNAAGKHMIDWYNRWKIECPFFESTDQLFSATRFLIDEVKKRGGNILGSPKLLLAQWMDFGKVGNGLPPMPPECFESPQNFS